MATTVVNIRKLPVGWISDTRYARIDRQSVFGNPVKIRYKCPVCGGIHKEAGSTIPCFRQYFTKRLAYDAAFRNAVYALRNKMLVCWCKPNFCHGDVIAEFLNLTFGE